MLQVAANIPAWTPSRKVAYFWRKHLGSPSNIV